MTLNPRQAVLYFVERLPEDASFEDIQYGLYVLQKIEAGLRDVREGRGIPHAEVVREMEHWFRDRGSSA